MPRHWIPQTYFLMTIYTRIPSAVNQKARHAESAQRPFSGVNDNCTNHNYFATMKVAVSCCSVEAS